MRVSFSVPGTQKARDLGDRGPRGSGNKLNYRSIKCLPKARATVVAGRPARRDPSRLFLVARLSREDMLESLYAAVRPMVKQAVARVVHQFGSR